MIVVIGSLNIDQVHAVPHIVRPGETLASGGVKRFAGGKGLNQSLALARAGARVRHAGRIGADGVWLRAVLDAAGVDCAHIRADDGATGSAFIQVDASGENAIVLDAGANARVDADDLRPLFAGCGPGDYLLLQNEISDLPRIMARGKERGMTVVFNPAPCGPEVNGYPLDAVDLLIVNETEAALLSGRAGEDEALAALLERHPAMRIVLTCGARGARYAARGEQRFAVDAVKANVVDTTAAGDTFIGYLLAGIAEGMTVAAAMRLAARAAAIAVSRPGAADSIPHRREVTAGGGGGR